MAALSGLRRGELFALQWPDVDWGRADSTCAAHLPWRPRYHPKTEHSDRVVDVPQRLLDDLAVYRECTRPSGTGLSSARPPGNRSIPITGTTGALSRILRQANLYRRGDGPHVLRHSYVSILVAQGEDIHYIADQVGHSSTRLTQDLYRHVFAKTRTEAMRRLNAAIPSGKISGRTSRNSGSDRNSMEQEP